MLKITENENMEMVVAIRNNLKQNGGYCPCAVKHDETTKCPCKKFRNKKTEGLCRCGLYRKVKVKD
jgi:hypothetical protein